MRVAGETAMNLDFYWWVPSGFMGSGFMLPCSSAGVGHNVLACIKLTMIGHRLTESMILRRAQKENLEHVKRVNLWGLRICDASLLQNVPALEVVSLSSNNISSLEPFSFCVNLKELYLRNNAIFDLNEVRHLSNLTLLHTLFLLGNPCCYPPSIEKVDMSTETSEYYRPTVIKHIPSLERLDLRLVSKDEKMVARQSTLIPFPVATDVDDGAKEQMEEATGMETNVAGNDSLLGKKTQKEGLVIGDNSVTASKELDCKELAAQVLGESSDLPSFSGGVQSIRQTISHLSLVNKQALTEILHLLPRLNDEALALLANEVANRRRHHEEMLSPASSARVTSP
ncbi:hypothetical protein TcWFU_003588 [Taenia crassiceps]|uniref:Uncharacterized protein n=1 Tax=Taenia crassiceps TaxID=6207 RepID=A0ABR4QB07_9CEST